MLRGLCGACSPGRLARSLSESWHGSRAWGLRGEIEARGGGDAAHRQRRATTSSPATPMRPAGSGGVPASAALPLLDKVPPCRRRGAWHLPARRSERDPCHYSDRLLAAMLNDRASLKAIARRAMIERGFEPDYSPSA